jgi:2-methylaconitate cis-trans-isomerase PrpF
MTRESERIRAAVIRGGTSKGVYLLANDLPRDPATRDRVILAIFGSPDSRQINGLGGADPLTSKVAIIARSSRPGADVDYTIGYVALDRPVVDYEGNCGNILQGVGPFAVDEGLVPAEEPVTRVRIFNTNTNKVMIAEVPVRDGRALTEGDCSIDGVPGTGARIVINFLDSAGSKTGKLLPTGNVRDPIRLFDGRSIDATLLDLGNPLVFVQARALGLTGRELPQEAGPEILATMEEIRARAAVMMGLADSAERASPAVPKISLVAEPQNYVTISGKPVAADESDLLARAKALGVLHKAFIVTGGMGAGAAAQMAGSVVHEVASARIRESGIVRVGHPSGVTPYMVSVAGGPSDGFTVEKTAVFGTARRIMDGYVYVPASVMAGRT